MKKKYIKAHTEKKYIKHNNSGKNTENLVLLGMFGTTLLSGALLTLPSVLADDSAVTDVAITVPVACAVTSTVGTAHTASVDSGTYEDDIGTTTIKATCNDSQGFSVYAIGYTNEEYGNTTLKPSVLDATQNSIITGTATNGDTSNWAMKLTASTGMTSANILSDTDGAYSNYHKVPTAYTKVAIMDSSTNATTGASIEATYAVYIAGDQPADTYNGKVKYTMVHPANEPAPFIAREIPTASGKICYYPSFDATAENGTMGCQTVSASDTSTMLLASNFSRDGYGFAGWTNKYDYATNPTQEGIKFYGPQEDITFTAGQYTGSNDGLSLYAVWVKSAGNLQDTTKVATLCGTGTGSLTKADEAINILSQSITALSDARDNNTYAIAKLADGKCWMIENLRLDNTAEHNTDGTLAQGYHSSFIGLADAESGHFSINDTTANSLYTTEADVANKNTISGNYQAYRFPRYNNLNTTNRAANPTSNTFINNNTTGGMYSYGNYYTWHAAIADTTYYSSGDHGTTSLCPTGWRLPIGAQSTADGSFGALNVALGGPTDGATADSSSTPTGTVMSGVFRSFPNNLLYSGSFYASSADNRGSYGFYWSSTANDYNYSYSLYLYSSTVYPGTGINNKNYGFSIRCVSDS